MMHVSHPNMLPVVTIPGADMEGVGHSDQCLMSKDEPKLAAVSGSGDCVSRGFHFLQRKLL